MASIRSEIQKAAKKGDAKQLAAVLGKAPAQKWINRALMQSCQYGRLDCVETVLRAGEPTNLDEGLFQSAMGHATIRKTADSVEIARLMLERGASPDARGGWNEEPVLIAAAADGDRAAVDLLLDHGAEVTLFCAAALGDTRRVKRALDRDPSQAGAVDTNGLMPLHTCARSRLGVSESATEEALAGVVDLLVEAGADVEARDEKPAGKTFHPNQTPLQWAASGGIGVTRALLAHGARVNPTGNWVGGFSISAVGTACKECPEIADLLHEAGADLEVKGKDGMTVLHAMANFPHPEAVAWLVAHGADVTARMDDGRTPLHRAAERNASDRVARMLVEAGADVSAQDAAGKTPLDYAVAKGKRKVAAFLESMVQA